MKIFKVNAEIKNSNKNVKIKISKEGVFHE